MDFEIFKFSLNNKQKVKEAVLLATEVLRNEGIVVHPTDTCYGLAVDITSKQSIENVLVFKNRKNILFNMIVKDFEQWEKYGKLLPLVKKIIENNKNNQYSFVVPRTKNVPDFFRTGITTVSIQIPKLKFSLQLLNSMQVPLVATSANVSGLDVCYSIKDFVNQFQARGNFNFKVLVLDAGKIACKKPSTIMEIKNNNTIQILRK